MAIYTFTANSAGAPSLTGQGGSLIAVLDWLLVTQMGWTKPFSGTNLAVYRQPVGSNQFYLRVDDSIGQNARVVGYETMSDVNTGTGPFPTAVQLSGGAYVYKSSTADATARQWSFWSDGKIFHLLMGYTAVPPTFNSTNLYQGLTFGDFKSYKPGDAYNTILIANIVTSATATGVLHGVCSSIWSTATSGHWVARSHTQTGTSIQVSKYFDNATLGPASATAVGAGSNAWPSPIDGGMMLGRLFIGEIGQGRRGHIPGMWAHGHAFNSLQSGDTITGAGDLAGRTFSYWQIASSSLVMETSDTWAT